MIKRIAHIGVAIENLDEAKAFFARNFEFSPSARESFGELLFSFVPINGTHIELLQSTTPEGQIAKFISKKGQGLHHISFEVDDIQTELNRLKSNGVTLIHEKPYPNAHEDLVAFLHPKSTFGVLVELIECRK